MGEMQISVDIYDVIEGLSYNGQPPERRKNRQASLRLSRPFGAEQDAELHYSGDSDQKESAMGDQPVDVPPANFVGGWNSLPKRLHWERCAGSWRQTAFGVWEYYVRNALQNRVAVPGDALPEAVAADYDSRGEVADRDKGDLPPAFR